MRLPSYPSYRDSGTGYLGEIPSAWQTSPVKRRYAVQLGKMLQNEPASEADALVPYLKALHVLWGKVNTTDLPEMWASAGETRQFGVRGGDLLVCEGGEAGRAGVLQSAPEPCIIQNAVHRVRGRGADVRYLQYALHSIGSAGWFGVLCNRATISHLTGEKLAELRVPLPSLNEQRSIAAFLDRETTKVDGLVAKKQALIEKLREKRAALISEVVTRGLPPEAARVAGLDPHPRLRSSGAAWIGGMPEHWDLTPLRYAFRNLDYRRIPIAGEDRATMDKVYPYYGASGIIDHVEDYLFDETLILVAEDGANLLSRSTPLAFMATGKYWVNNHAHILRPLTGDIRYWAAALQTYDYTPLVSGAAQPKLTAERLGDVRLPKPPPDEQRAIADFLDHETEKLDRLAATVEAAISRLQEYRAALITAAVTGRIDVREAVA